MPVFSPVKQTRVADEIFEQIKAAILSGRYKAGDKLPSERELTELFRASRVVVREAIRSLEIKGFVVIRQGPLGGAYVRELTFDGICESFFDLFLAGHVSVTQLMQARRHIQPEVARLAAENLNQESAQLLQTALKKEEADHPTHAERVMARMATDLTMAKICGNTLFQAIVETLIHLTRQIIVSVKPETQVFHDQQEHRAVVAAVLERDGEKAARLMRLHLEGVGSQLIRLEGNFRDSKARLAVRITGSRR